jgi:uncharacterized protein YfbU (UPF0304 family)
MKTIDKINTIMLCNIIDHFGINSDIDTATVKYAVETGNLWVLNAKYSHFSEDEPSKEVRDEVISILNMYRGLSAALRKLPDDKQKKIIGKFDLRVIDKHIQIPGFDGNNESDYFSVIESFVKIDRFVEQKLPVDNTHDEAVPNYQLMLDAFNKLSAVNRRFELTDDEISSVLEKSPRGI